MANALIALTGIVLLLAAALVWFNRASPTVVGAAFPAATGLLSALALVFAFNRPEPISRVFPVVFAIEKTSLLPITIPDRPFPFASLALPPMMKQKDAKAFAVPEGQSDFDVAVPLYHEYLQKMFVDDLAMKQSGTWRMRTERFTDMIQFSPTPDASAHKSRVLTVEELEKAFGQNRFAAVYSAFGKWALPPGTELQIDRPKRNEQLGEVGLIRLKNRFCTVSIQTIRSLNMVGLGKYTPLIGASIDEAQKGFFTVQFITRIDASFPWYLSGHPHMRLYREWVNALVDELTFSFDEDSLWSRTKDNYLLKRHYQNFPPGLELPVAPMRVADPPAAAQAEPQKPEEK